MSTPTSEDSTAAAVEYEPLEYVYCGRRWIEPGKLSVVVRPIKDSKLLPAMGFVFNRKLLRTVGGVYTGAEFSQNGARGLSAPNRYLRVWPNQAELIDWQARDEHAESVARSKKLEADAKKIGEIEKLLLPLRIQYNAYKDKRDHAGMEALVAAVARALASRPRSTEL